ncbi:hypothetical protein A3F64_01275 [Candidatus Saccharibacteria bacterium RIFCSPHIGHO2_12_FULL_42_8]|nr:MAG: hypothetical protein A3F64_01275 [Candidatus Saccharibacteria bacterium RIFCSPHIGHO2_12_FULL_42_8]
MSTEKLPQPEEGFDDNVIDFEVARLNAEFAKLNPMQRIERAHELFGDDLVLATTFGPTAPFLLQVGSSVDPNIKVVNIQHGYETEETKNIARWYINEFNLNVVVYKSPKLPIPPEGTPEFEEFQQKLKVEPFQRMIDDLQPKAYLSGIMEWQTAEREGVPIVQRKGSVLAINPLLGLTERDIDYYLEVCGFPKNNDYFDPTKGSSQKKECQLNTSVYR